MPELLHLLRSELCYLVSRVDTDLYDVAIIGGGPAGSTAASLLGKAGRRVAVCEREKFPRFHIGESLLPASMRVFTRLGLHEKFLRAGFIEKFGGEMCSSCGGEGVRFYFQDGFRSNCDRAYQVTRAEFDKLLLDHAMENGAHVQEETTVQSVDFGPDFVTLRTKGKDGATEEIRARYLIDASGRNAMVGSQFKLKQNYEELQKISFFAHYKGAVRLPGRDGTLTRMVRGLDRWFWLIPLADERISIGVVLDSARFRQSKQDPEAFFEAAIAEQPLLVAALAGATRVTPVHTAADFSYRNKKLAGEKWLLAGDAAGFIDPVFSSGVFLAVMAGEASADILNEVLDHPSRARRLFARYERRMQTAMDVYARFVNAWYKKEFIEVFLHPQDFFQIPPAVNAVLGGNLGSSFAIKWRMWLFYFLVAVQKFIPLCPRRTLLPQQSAPSPTSPVAEVVSSM